VHDLKMIAHHLIIHGRVQGVNFRSATRQTARRHGVAGWVRNRDDGAVEARLEGEPDALESVEAWIETGGPPNGEVDRVEIEEVPGRGVHDVRGPSLSRAPGPLPAWTGALAVG
jgi:acylphosphatase